MSQREKYPAISDDDVATIEQFLSRNEGGEIPNFETLDGFLTALIIGPDFVPPSEFMSIITSDPQSETRPIFENGQEVEQFFEVLMRHWNHINEKYNSGDVYTFYLAEDDGGNVKGNDWATGFMSATHLRHHSWAAVLNNEDLAGMLVPIFALKYENDPDISLRPYKDPITRHQREKLITVMIVCVKKLYDLFREEGEIFDNSERMPVPSEGKVGRNDPCPCGSGKKFKKCCALKTFH